MKTVKHVIVGTAGHIDHGKSALVRALTGTDPDRLKEEKERGITIDLGFAFLSEPSGEASLHLGFVDVPGHERFVKNMLAGVGGIDLVMLVVAADESVMPQTREHFDICRLLQIKKGLIAITKVDLVEGDLRELATMEVRELVAGSFLDGAPIVSVSAKTGEGLDELRRALLEVARKAPPRPAGGLFRLPVDRVFSMKGFGTVVTGTLVSGSVGLEEEVEVLPRGLTPRVRGLQVHGRAVERASAGQRTAVNLQGVEVSDILRGDTLACPGTLSPSLMLDAELEVLRPSPIPIKDLTRVHLHLGTAGVVARARVLGGRRAIPAGARGLVQLRLESPVVAVPGDRFIIRRYSPLETLGGGVVLDAAPVKHAVSSRDVVEKLHSLRSGDPVEAAGVFVAEAGAQGITEAALARRLGMDKKERDRVLAALVNRGRALQVSSRPLRLMAPDAAEAMSRCLMDELKRFQKAHPLHDGMPKGELREKVSGASPAEVFECILARLVDEGRARAVRDRVATADHRIQLTRE
ncbi:MAG: selenocysteine-specific translation elongation factor, partial [Acidobacteriota bacterium]